MKTHYDNLFLKYVYPWRRKIQLSQFEKWIEDATEGLNLFGKKVLIVSCGPGFEIVLLSKKVGSGGKIDAFDISEEMISYAKKLTQQNSLGNINLFVGDAQEEKFFTKDFYDYVFIILGLSVIPDYIKTIQLSKKTIKDGGGIVVFDSQTPNGLKGKLIDFYHKIFHAYNKPIVNELENNFVTQSYKIYPGKTYFLWKGIKQSNL